jgi:hypothetical protein
LGKSRKAEDLIGHRRRYPDLAQAIVRKASEDCDCQQRQPAIRGLDCGAENIPSPGSMDGQHAHTKPRR